jgi:hypothetical protein
MNNNGIYNDDNISDDNNITASMRQAGGGRVKQRAETARKKTRS